MNRQKYLELKSSLDLTKKWLPLLNFIVGEVMLFGASFLLASMGFYFLLFPIVATVMFRNFSLMHDASHGAVSNNKKINDIIGFWCGCLCLLPFTEWKILHLQHHFWSGNYEKDPVMRLRLTLPKASKNIQSFLTFAWRKWIPVLAVLQYVLFWRLALSNAFSSTKSKSWFNILGTLTFWGALFYFLPEFGFKAVLPALFVYMLAVEVVNFPHHLQLPMFSGEKKVPVWQQYETARTCLYPKWFARSIVLNFNFHSEHHMFPEAPWYTLETIHRELQKELGEKENIDPYFAWIKQNRTRTLLEVIAPKETKKAA